MGYGPCGSRVGHDSVTEHLVPAPIHDSPSLPLLQKWVGTPFTASSLELRPWSPGVHLALEMCSPCPPQGAAKGLVPTELPDTTDLVEADGVPELCSPGD